jgi:hypothetical protein
MLTCDFLYSNSYDGQDHVDGGIIRGEGTRMGGHRRKWPTFSLASQSVAVDFSLLVIKYLCYFCELEISRRCLSFPIYLLGSALLTSPIAALRWVCGGHLSS